MTPRAAVFAAFISFGVGYGTWAGTIATVAQRTATSPQMLGFAVTGFIASHLLGMAAAGVLSRRLAVKSILLGAFVASALLIALLMQAASPLAFILGLIGFGLTVGATDGSMNAEGTMVEADVGRPILVGFHASSSLTVGAAAIVGSLVAVRLGTVATAVISVAGYALGFAIVLAATPLRAVGASDPGERREAWRFGRPILLLGLVVGISIAGETGAIMFSTPAIAARAPELVAYAGFGASAFSLCQGMARLGVDPLRRRFGDLRVMEVSVLVALAGFVVVATSASLLQTALGFALVGLGTACLVPCGFSLAPSYSGLAAAQALALIAIVSALPRIPAPLAFGGLAGSFDYSVAFALNAVLFGVAFVLVLLLKRVMVVRRDGSLSPAPPS